MTENKKVNKNETQQPQTIQKPVAVLQKELEEKVINAIQESGLHISLIANYFQKLTTHLAQLEEENRQAEIAQYNAQIEQIESDNQTN